MSKMPPRDRLYLGMACIFAVLFCVCCAYWWATPWFYLGCFLSVMLYWSNDHYWQVPVFPYDRILSAHSNDGLHWLRESGVRVDVDGVHENLQVYNPVVTKMQLQWRMFYRAGGNNSSIASSSV